MQWPKPRGYDPNAMLYPDRRMLKWQGMLLSDHTETILADQAAKSLRREAAVFDEQELARWDEILQASIANELPIRLTIDQPGKPLSSIIGIALKVDENGVCLMTERGKEVYPFDCIIKLECLF